MPDPRLDEKRRVADGLRYHAPLELFLSGFGLRFADLLEEMTVRTVKTRPGVEVHE